MALKKVITKLDLHKHNEKGKELLRKYTAKISMVPKKAVTKAHLHNYSSNILMTNSKTNTHFYVHRKSSQWTRNINAGIAQTNPPNQQLEQHTNYAQ